MSYSTRKPGRPLGVTIAIVASVIVFSLLPLLRVGLIVAVEQRFNVISEVSVPLGEQEVAPFASGGNFDGGLSDAEVILQVVLSVGFLVVAFFAWRGGSQLMRYVFMGAVALLAVIAVLLEITAVFAPDPQTGLSGGSLDALLDALGSTTLLLRVIIPVYVLWYLNRGPARAFYRGYFLDEPARASATKRAG